MGGNIPFGYDLDNRKLRVPPEEAATLRRIFERFAELGSATVLVKEIRAQGVVGKKGRPFDKSALYRLLRNRLYLGEAVHKGTSYPGEHEAIIDQALWDKVHGTLKESPRKRALHTRVKIPALLRGLIFTATGIAMTPTSTNKGNRRYRYYVSMDLIKSREIVDDGIPKRLPAGTVEDAVLKELRRIIRAPETAAQVIAALTDDEHSIPDDRVVTALQQFDDLWEQLFPAEQARLVQLLVRRVTVTAKGLVIDIRAEGIAHVLRDMMIQDKSEAA